ncbi:MAG: FKBP-type peptidyl-prolyl cis-trans isomerase [Bacteroidota bacterium]|nr:FKBP-type peptidyl-prolyl cis-trans isomerase [Bacteroidota bacterium]
MTIRLLSAALAMTILSACSQGQKGRVELKNEMDSVSYAIGTDIGNNFKESKLDSVNVDAIAMGLRDGLDSTSTMTPEALQQVIQGYMMRKQAEKMAEDQAKGEVNKTAGEKYLAENGKKSGVQTTASGLQYEVMTMGTGPKPAATDEVKVHYTGRLIDGTEFDSSVTRGEPAIFPVGQVIPGWVEGIQMMPVGSKFKFHIPSDLAYGSGGAPGGTIPANSVLIFDVELLEIIAK